MKKKAVDYRSFRLSKLNTPEFSHVKLLLYWPLYGLVFMYVERFYPAPFYCPMHCALDDMIPFNEFFLIPYLFWFVYLTGMIIYTFFYDTEAFRKMMRFIIISYSITIFIYLSFPTCQQLRPESFPRDNMFTDMVRGFYEFDTNTNVCPSLHVIGSMAVLFTAFNCESFSTKGWKWAFSIAAFLICISTVFLKQHSVLDLAAAMPVSLIGWFFAFKYQRRHSPKLSSAHAG